jgi:Mg2+-importing ATPase
MTQHLSSFWSVPPVELLERLQTTPKGLTDEEAQQRLERYGPNRLKPKKKFDVPSLLIAQFKSPIIIILLFAAGLAFFLHDAVDACIIIAIVFVSGLLGFWQEYGAVNALQKLVALVQVRATVLRDGRTRDIPVEEVVSGDIVILKAGDLISGIVSFWNRETCLWTKLP